MNHAPTPCRGAHTPPALPAAMYSPGLRLSIALASPTTQPAFKPLASIFVCLQSQSVTPQLDVAYKQCHPDVSVLFADIVGFTTISKEVDPEQVTIVGVAACQFMQRAKRCL